MGKKPVSEDSSPQEFAQTTPRDLHSTSDIRFVMRETATLTERIEGLTKAIDKLGPSLEKALDKQAADLKERIADIKADSTKTSDKLETVKTSIDSFKGAMKVFGGLYALALVLTAAFLAWYLRPAPASVVSPAITPAQDSAPHSNALVPVVPGKG